MFEQIEHFFNSFIGSDVFTEHQNAFKALVICVCVMLVYGLLIRPFLHICLVKKKSFFDIIMVALVIILGVSITFPGMFVIDGFTQEDLDSYYEQGKSDGYDAGEMVGYDEGYADGTAAGGGYTLTEYATFTDCPVITSQASIYHNSYDSYANEKPLYSSSPTLTLMYSTKIDDPESEDQIYGTFNGIPAFIVDGTTYYVYTHYDFIFGSYAGSDYYYIVEDFFYIGV